MAISIGELFEGRSPPQKQNKKAINSKWGQEITSSWKINCTRKIQVVHGYIF